MTQQRYEIPPGYTGIGTELTRAAEIQTELLEIPRNIL